MFTKIVLATQNQGKVREISQRVADFPCEFIALPTNAIAPDETGLTFVENAIIKARAACESTNLPALADDSGLIVDALDGAPGVHSARYAGDHVSGEQHIAKVLSALAGVPKAMRTARFFCVLAFMRNSDDPSPIIFEGSWEGRILETPQGEGGFGYDPIFYVPEYNCTAAGLDPALKAKTSHRGQALDKFMAYLQAFAR